MEQTINLCTFCGHLSPHHYTCINCHTSSIIPLPSFDTENECPICFETTENYKYYKCGHQLCLSCSLKRDTCYFNCKQNLIPIEYPDFINTIPVSFLKPIMKLNIDGNKDLMAYAQWLHATKLVAPKDGIFVSALPEYLFKIWQKHCATKYLENIIYSNDKAEYYHRFYKVYQHYLAIFSEKERMVTNPHPEMDFFMQCEYQIFARFDRSRCIGVYSTISILQLKYKIMDIFDLSMLPRLTYAGKALENDKTIEYYNIQEYSTVQALFSLRGD